MLKAFLLLVWGIVTVHSLEIKVLAQETPYDAPQQLELNSLRLAINFNSKYIYPHRPNTFHMYPCPYPVPSYQSVATSWR